MFPSLNRDEDLSSGIRLQHVLLHYQLQFVMTRTVVLTVLVDGTLTVSQSSCFNSVDPAAYVSSSILLWLVRGIHPLSPETPLIPRGPDLSYPVDPEAFFCSNTNPSPLSTSTARTKPDTRTDGA